jgi:hypothetical protein
LITDVAARDYLLDRLSQLGMRWAIAHELPATWDQASRDVDIIVSRPPSEFIAGLKEVQGEYSCISIGVWDYGAVSSVWASQGFSSIVQLDFSYDPHGRGSIGMLTANALADPREERWPFLSDDASAAYRISKHALKRRYGACRGEASTMMPAAWRFLTPSRVRRIERTMRELRPPRAVVRAYEQGKFSLRGVGRLSVSSSTVVVVSSDDADGEVSSFVESAAPAFKRVIRDCAGARNIGVRLATRPYRYLVITDRRRFQHRPITFSTEWRQALPAAMQMDALRKLALWRRIRVAGDL